MKKLNSVKKLLMVFVFAVSMAILVPTVSPVSTQAAVKKVNPNTNYKKCPSLKKGTYLINAKKNHAYVKFQAPSDGTYCFTISDIKTKGVKNDPVYGHISFHKPNSYNSISLFDVKTKGGKTCFLNLCTKYAYDNFEKYKQKKITTASYFASRTGTVKLKRGDVIYLDYYHASTKGCTYKLNIKKK